MTYRALTVSPAYGRDYDSRAEALEAWNSNRDFMSPNLATTYINKRDIETYPHGFTHIRIKYKKLTEVLEVKL